MTGVFAPASGFQALWLLSAQELARLFFRECFPSLSRKDPKRRPVTKRQFGNLLETYRQHCRINRQAAHHPASRSGLRRLNHPLVRSAVVDAEPDGAACPTLATGESRLTQANAVYRHRDVLRHLLTTCAARTRYRLRVAFYDRGARDRKRALGRAADLQLEESFAGVSQFD